MECVAAGFSYVYTLDVSTKQAKILIMHYEGFWGEKGLKDVYLGILIIHMHVVLA